MENKIEEKLLRDYFFPINFSPTPIPRKKLIPQTTQEEDEDEDNKHLNKKMITDIENFSSDNIFNTNSFITSTMPLPRKPRKKILKNEFATDESINFYEEPNQDVDSNCFENSSYAVSDYTNKILNSIKISSTQFLLHDIQEALAEISNKKREVNKPSELGTLKKNFQKLERPSAPPPPPPKNTHTTLYEFSKNNSLITTNETEFKKSCSYLNSTQVSTLLSTPDMSSTPRKQIQIDSGISSLLDTNLTKNVNYNLNNFFGNFNKTSSRTNFNHHKNLDFRKNFLGFEPINREIELKNTDADYQEKRMLKKIFFLIKLKLNLLSLKYKIYFFDYLMLFSCFLLFLLCILSISLFQTKVNEFYRKFLSKNSTTNDSISTLNKTEDFYYTAGSDLVKETILFCNGPYFTYQINNLICLPFSLLLVFIFSFFNERESSCFKKNHILKKISKRPGLPATINPFQRRNRFLVAALFCILANEIFKMIESSMFDVSNKESFNSTTHLLNSILNPDLNKANESSHSKFAGQSHSNADLLKIGFGIEPNLIQKYTKSSRTTRKTTKTTKPFFLIAPSVLQYSKPKLKPRLNINDFQTTATSSTASYGIHDLVNLEPKSIDGKLTDIKLNINIAGGSSKLKQVKNKTYEVINSLNQTLIESSNQTLFEFSMNIYKNKYVQSFVRKLFDSRELNWSLIVGKLEKIGLMLIEVFIIGTRYYPLMSVLDKKSLVCLLLASVYMWFDIFYNVAITGLCEGLKLNVSFDLLKDIRRIFGVGFIYDAKEYFKLDSETKILNNGYSSTDQEPIPVDAKLLFSTNRILYSIIKSLPHFFCLSYVTVRLTSTFIYRVYKKIKDLKKEKIFKAQNLYYYDDDDYNKNYIINSNEKFDLIYTKVASTKKQNSIRKSLNLKTFEDRYVKNLLKNSTINTNKWFFKIFDLIFDNNFRFSTRIVCTYTVCFTVLYYLTCFLIFYGSIFIDMIYLPVGYKNSIILSTFITSFICLIQLILSMKQLKFHLKCLYKGNSERYISSMSLFTNKKIVTSSFNYAGYTVTYTCWGYLILFFILTFISFQIATLVEFGSTTLGLFFVLILMPFLISLFIIKLINKIVGSFLAKFCFLQNKSKDLALKNFKFYSLLLYFKFFYDCFTGIAFCFVRMIKSVFLSIIFLPRLDYSFMGRSLEKMDTAFMSYIGFLYWESHHTNPVLVSFCDQLNQELKRKNRKKKNKTNEIKSLNFIKARNRWHLFYTLYKNPCLINYRKF